jgi:hypothetical protein
MRRSDATMRRLSGRSTAASGSSSNRTSGDDISARASATRCFSPPNSAETGRSISAPVSTIPSTSSSANRRLPEARPGAARRRPAPNRTFPRTSSCGKSSASWGHVADAPQPRRKIVVPCRGVELTAGDGNAPAGRGAQPRDGLEAGGLARPGRAEERQHAAVALLLDLEHEAVLFEHESELDPDRRAHARSRRARIERVVAGTWCPDCDRRFDTHTEVNEVASDATRSQPASASRPVSR